MNVLSSSNLGWPDLVVIVVYFAFVLFVGLYSARKSKSDSVSGYFLASRNMSWIPVGASIFASNIGSGHFIGLAGFGASSGIASGAFELMGTFTLMMLGWLFVPVYMSSGVYTMPEYIRERFGGQRIRIYLSILALLLYVFTKISADLFAGAIFIQEAIGQSSQEWLYISVLILLAIAAIFTITGGLTAVMWTDFVQTILMILGSLVLMIISFQKVGGYEELLEKYPYSTASNVTEQYEKCARPPDYAMHFFRSATPGESDLPWPGLTFGILISSIWYWCTDQVIVQRALASKTLSDAKGGCCLASALKFLPLFLLVFPGMCARVLYPDEVACVDPEECQRICGSSGGCSNVAYIKLVLGLLPQGVRGMMLAVMMAALMSSLTSIFNSSSTIFTIDIWERIRRKSWKNMDARAIDLEKLMIGRMFVLFLVVVSVVWIPVIQQSAGSQLFVYIQSISSFMSPPICAVYLLAIFWKRTNEPGAFWGLIIGLVIGIVRFGMEFAYIVPSCGSNIEDPRPEIIKLLVGQVHYLYFGILLFMITVAITVSISLLTEPIPDKCLRRLTFNSRFNQEPRTSVREWRNEVLNIKPEVTTENSLPKKSKKSAGFSFIYKICGLKTSAAIDEEDRMEEVKSPEQMAKEAVEFLNEDIFTSNILNAAAIAILSATVFLFGFYA